MIRERRKGKGKGKLKEIPSFLLTVGKVYWFHFLFLFLFFFSFFSFHFFSFLFPWEVKEGQRFAHRRSVRTQTGQGLGWVDILKITPHADLGQGAPQVQGQQSVCLFFHDVIAKESSEETGRKAEELDQSKQKEKKQSNQSKKRG